LKVQTENYMLHPILSEYINSIEIHVIEKHKAPFRLFETGRTHGRHQELLNRGKTQDAISAHLYNLDNDPPLYATAIDYVFHNGKSWSWNFRDSTISSWYSLFGNLVLDVCSGLTWGALNRKSMNYTHFQLKQDIILDNLDHYQCVIR
jgi:hypothetical protein